MAARLALILACNDIPHMYISPVTGLEWPTGFQEVKVPRFHDNGTQECGKVVSPTHRPHLPPRNSTCTHFC